MEWLKDLNQYSNLILVIVTVIYVYLTYKMLKSNKELIQETTRPYVVVDLSAIDNKILLNIKNEGNRAAFNIRILIKPNLFKLFKPDIINHEYQLIDIPFIAPKSETIEVLYKMDVINKNYKANKDIFKITHNGEWKESKNVAFEIKINYNSKNFSNKKEQDKYDFCENYEFDIFYSLGEEMKYSLQHSISNSMEKLNRRGRI